MGAIQATPTYAGLALWASAAAGLDIATIKFVAVGDGTTTPSNSDTKLKSEKARTSVNVTAGSTSGEFIATGTFQTSDAVGINITEIGFFAGGKATSTKDSGVLIARALWQHSNKSNKETITLSLDYTI